MVIQAPQCIFKLINRIEKFFANLLGKGWGSATMSQEVNLLQSFLKSKPQLAIDIGGNVGSYTAELRKRNPNLEIHVFEPSSVNIEKLKSRYQNDKLVTIIPLAVSNVASSAILYASEPGAVGGSLTKRKLDHYKIPFDAVENVQTIRFDDYWKDVLNSRPLDMVKIDIEGHELDAFEGFGAAIHATKVLQFEFGGCNIDTRTFFQDFWYFFKDRHFEIYRITPLGAEKIENYNEYHEFYSTTNYIAVNRNK